MNTRYLPLGLALSLMLAGCANQPSLSTQMDAVKQAHAAGNNTLAFKRLQRIVKNNPTPHNQYELGYFYFYGLGTPRDILSARHYFQMAAQAGNRMAQTALNQLDQRGASE